MRIGIVGFSFGLTDDEPSQVNRRLALEVERLVTNERLKGNESVVVAQWEIAQAIPPDSPGNLSRVVHRPLDAYLDSDEVMRQAAEEFRSQGVEQVIAVANPFLQLRLVRQLVREHGFHCLEEKIKSVGFCPESKQWQDRGPTRLLLYAVLRRLFGYRQRPVS